MILWPHSTFLLSVLMIIHLSLSPPTLSLSLSSISEYCGEPPPEVSSTIHRPAAEGCEANEEHNTPPVTTAMTMFPPMQKGQENLI